MNKISSYRKLAGIANSSADKSTGTLQSSTPKQKILIVDDDDLSRKLISRLVSKEFDYEIVSKSNGIEALEYAQEHVPLLIILDLMLPGMNGFEILKKVRGDQKFEQTKVVLVSAKSRSEDIEHGFDLTADEYITKPFQPKEFAARIRKLLIKAA
ncbi:response regulator [Fodinibius sp.]|uniref:response regulator transcription factor n=1 Tax=Fodinibius sp. TaxID=1872440 RepID=UPI002ACDFDA6|nr:response regulator [Fodinibius sp.]MDZ7658747.1 response regulator [Fodinibius sp.]